jgi:aerobic-type carbon monoxide dehydrogenase small subunit (CoxS/CutS family)
VKITLDVNGNTRPVDIHPGETLMETLRRLGLVSVKDGCARGDCGACAVLLDGRAVTACLLFTAQAQGHAVTTTEGLADEEGLHPLQRALLDAGGIQCGFCTPGVLMASMDLLTHNPTPSEPDIRLALAGNLCRCTGYVKIVEAVGDAASAFRHAEETSDG